MEASQMYCDLPPQSAFNFAGYAGLHGLPPTPPHTEEEPMTVATQVAQDDCGGASVPFAGVPLLHKRPLPTAEPATPVATTTAVAATATRPDDRLRTEPCKRPKRESAPSPEIDIVSVPVVRSSSPDPVQLKPRQEKIWRPYGATDE